MLVPFPKCNLWLSILLIVVAGVAENANSFENPFVFDDRHTIEENFNVRQLPDVVTAMGAPDGSCVSGQPLVALSLAVNFTLAKAMGGDGLDVVGYRVFNLLAHLAGAAWALLLARAALTRFLAERSAQLLALAIAALWVDHPLIARSGGCKRSEGDDGRRNLAIIVRAPRRTLYSGSSRSSVARRARHPKAQEAEALLSCNLPDQMAELGMPGSVSIGP